MKISSPELIAMLDKLLQETEAERLEFKEAKSRYDFEKLVRYCCALANEGGGQMVLGVSDKRPRLIVGTKAFPEPKKTVNNIVEQLRLRVEVDEIFHPDGRVLLYRVPPRPSGFPIQVNGTYWMRAGDSLVPMTNDKLQAIFNETAPDFTAEICSGLRFSDLDSEAIEVFRHRWAQKSGLTQLLSVPAQQLLEDAELVHSSGITYAALILFGTRQALGRHLAQAEIIYEYRSTEGEIRTQDRAEYRQAFFLYYDSLWTKLDSRNDLQSFQEGLFRREIATFNEGVVREALLNAVCHRDYRLSGSVFVKQYPKRLEVISPGGFPPGVTPDNILQKQTPRNRRLAEAFARCGLVERSGQGLDIIYQECLREAKALPDFSGTDEHQVFLALNGQIQEPRFLQFLEKVGSETQRPIYLDDLLVLNAVYADSPVPEDVQYRLPKLVEDGLLERVGKGRGRRFVLARRFYTFLGKKGTHTRATGLDRDTNKALILAHLKKHKKVGAPLSELKQVLPALSQGQLQNILQEMKNEGQILVRGQTRGARWFPGAE